MLYERCTASAAGEEFALYFHRVVDALKVYLVNTQTEDQRKVQIQAVGKFFSSLFALHLTYTCTHRFKGHFRRHMGRDCCFLQPIFPNSEGQFAKCRSSPQEIFHGPLNPTKCAVSLFVASNRCTLSVYQINWQHFRLFSDKFNILNIPLATAQVASCISWHNHVYI